MIIMYQDLHIMVNQYDQQPNHVYLILIQIQYVSNLGHLFYFRLKLI